MSNEPASERDEDGAGSPWRTLQYLSLARLVVAIGLLLSIAAFSSEANVWMGPAYVVAATVYFVGAAALALLAIYLRRRELAQIGAQIAFDLIVISALMVASGGLRSGLVVLYLLPLSGASLLLPTAAVFFVCSLAVITVLLDTFARALVSSSGAEASMFQAGLYGAMLFAITALLRLLAERLEAQELLAQRRGRNLYNQLAINRLVIAQLEQGVVVVDPGTHVRANNRAARLLFGLDSEAQLTGKRLNELPRLAPLVEAFERWRETDAGEHGRRAAIVEVPELRLRVRFVQPALRAGDEFLIFVEDQRALDQRAQQLKLASMGRLTASIAHEIRNPLAAISHAGQLLVEDAQEPGLRRLASIVRENTLRLNRLVDDILRVARREAPLGDDFDLGDFLRPWLQEFEHNRALTTGRIKLDVQGEIRVKFEQSHLRQVLYNLIDNALRYASDATGAVRVVVDAKGSDRVSLWVFDDGAGIAPPARDTLFEPFSTTHSKGTGLGLYIAREFCLANRCELVYAEFEGDDGARQHGFVLRFGSGRATVPETPDFLDTIVPYE